MKKIILFWFIFIGIVSYTQNDSGYDFVVLSDKFDFLSETNQHNLNELSKFLIAKKGFSAYFHFTPKTNLSNTILTLVKS